MAASGDDQAPGRPRAVRLRGATILLCGKCLKRHVDGKGLRRAVKSEAKARAAEPGSGKVRVVKVGCLGLCPRRAVVVASAAGLARGEVVLVRDATEVPQALARLLRPDGMPGRPGSIVTDRTSATAVDR